MVGTLVAVISAGAAEALSAMLWVGALPITHGVTLLGAVHQLRHIRERVVEFSPLGHDAARMRAAPEAAPATSQALLTWRSLSLPFPLPAVGRRASG